MAKSLKTELMWRRVAVVAGLIVVCGGILIWWCCFATTTTVLLVRHADRQGSQDALSSAGLARAQTLVHVLQKSGIDAIYQSDAVRTQQTAAPVASALGITPTTVTATNIDSLVNDIRASHRGQTVLVVGHSNTVPQIIAALGGPTLPNIDENEFDNLFVLQTGCCCGRGARLVNLQYGAASP